MDDAVRFRRKLGSNTAATQIRVIGLNFGVAGDHDQAVEEKKHAKALVSHIYSSSSILPSLHDRPENKFRTSKTSPSPLYPRTWVTP